MSALIDSLAWPAAVLVLAVIFRKPIEYLILSLRRVRYGKLEADFAEKLERVEAVTGPVSISEIAGRASGEVVERKAHMFDLAGLSPRSAVLEAWRDVESSAMELAQRENVPPPRSGPGLEHFLVRQEILTSSEADGLRELRQMRNQAAHAGEFDLTPQSAMNYAALAAVFAERLRQTARRTDG